MAKIYGQLEKAQAENTTSDTGSLPKGMLTYRTDTNILKVSNGTAMQSIFDTTQIITVANGGTGINVGTSGGIPYFSSNSTIASSGVLTQYGMIYGGGAGVGVTVVPPDSSTTKVLISGGASANPAFGLITNSNLSGSAAISNANLASMATLTIKGNSTGGSATPSDLSVATVQSMLAGAWSSYTPTVGSATGSITTKSATGYYIQIGKLVFFQMEITITTNGTGATAVTATLPTNANHKFVFAGRENATSGKMMQGNVSAGSSTVNIFDYANAYPAVDGSVIWMSGSYEST